MRDLHHYNQYQQLLLSALALVHEEDLIAVFRAARNEEDRCPCIDLVNTELDKGGSLMEIFAGPNELYDLFANDWPELRVILHNDNMVSVTLGTNTAEWMSGMNATMPSTGVVTELRMDRIYNKPT